MRDWPWYSYIVIAIIILGLFYFLQFKPKNEELNNIREERILVDQEVQRLQAKKEQLDQIEEELVNLNKTLKQLETIIPKKEEISTIVRKMQQLASDSRLNLEKIDPKGWITKEFHMERPYSIKVSGNYHNLGIFFDRLSSLSRLFNVEDFTIKALRRQTNTATISSDWTAKTYIFIEEAAYEEKTEQKGKIK